MSADPKEQEISDDELELQFRAIRVADKRRGIRLERLYWDLLKDIADRLGQPRSQMIASILEDDASTGVVTARLLRAYTAKTIESERKALTERDQEAFYIELLQRAPVPAFAINRSKKLSGVNHEFVQLLQVLAGDLQVLAHPDVVQLKLDKPIDALLEELKDIEAVTCNYSVEINDRRRRGRAKIIGIPPEISNTIVGYVVS